MFCDGTGNGKTLLLSSGHVRSALRDRRFIFLRFFFDKFFRLGNLCCLNYLGIRCFGVSKTQVGRNRSGKQHTFLRYKSNLLTQVFHRKFPDINTVQCYASLRHIIQTRNQIHDRRFSTTGTSDDRRSLPRISSEVNVVNRRLPAARICEIHMVKFQHTL